MRLAKDFSEVEMSGKTESEGSESVLGTRGYYAFCSRVEGQAGIWEHIVDKQIRKQPCPQSITSPVLQLI